MHLFITDSQSLYEAHPSPHKCWIDGALVKASGFLTEVEQYAMNEYNNSVEVDAGDACLVDLYETVNRLKGCPTPNSPFIQHKDEFERIYGLLFEPFGKFGFFRHMVRYWFHNYFFLHPTAIEKVTFDLSETYSWLEVADLQTGFCFDVQIKIRPYRESWKTRIRSSVKNLAYFFQKYLNADHDRRDDLTHMLLVSYKLPHHTSILNTFYRLVANNPKLALHIVLLDHNVSDPYRGLDDVTAACDRIKTYEFKEFREGNFVRFGPFHKALRRLNPKFDVIRKEGFLRDAEVNYTWLNRAFEELQPDVCMVMSTHEIGRYLADVANYQKVPTIHFDYGLFSDHHIMESRIDFSIRASISQAVTDIWKKRNDCSLKHIPIGFVKLDEMPPKEQLLTSKDAFFSEHGFDPNQPTVFFASCWTFDGKVYDLEKLTIVEQLSERCMRNGWNLIVKKHPLEDDDGVKTVLDQHRYPRQKVFHHRELSLNAAILFSDVTTTQMSSIVLEALFYDKPVCFLSSSDNKVMNLAGMENNPLTPLFCDFDAFETYLRDGLFQSQISMITPEEIARLKEYVLYSSDQQSSQRLLDLALQLAEQKIAAEKN